ncbi:hypothetical protein SAMN05878482_104112 [Peribacillus simplex]|uniref:Uncharacterized protein n=1 Tax=Peribacillus simplex TaxID=1478 RepID=A0A9X8WL15_9BACI|nr:hypothetical protein SAMN05878482_104112 [Peribacillus simplex]
MNQEKNMFYPGFFKEFTRTFLISFFISGSPQTNPNNTLVRYLKDRDSGYIPVFVNFEFFLCFKQISGNNKTLNLLRPFIDLGDFSISHITFNRVFPCVSISAEYLNGLHRYFHGGVSSK